MNYFSVKFRVSASALTTLLQTTEKANGIELESITPISDAAPTKKSFHYANGKRNKGISSEALLLELTKGGRPVSIEAAVSAFAEKEFARNSVYSAISKAIREGKLAKDKDGSLRIAPKAK
jgi:hypothetical protein